MKKKYEKFEYVYDIQEKFKDIALVNSCYFAHMAKKMDAIIVKVENNSYRSADALLDDLNYIRKWLSYEEAKKNSLRIEKNRFGRRK